MSDRIILHVDCNCFYASVEMLYHSDLVFVLLRMYLYLRFSRMARAIYQDYCEQVESFGLDECWIDLTDSCVLLGDHGFCKK